MADVLKLFEDYLKKIGGECVEIRINYDKIPLFVEGSVRNKTFWHLVSEFVDKVQALVQENALKIKESHHGHGEDQKNTDLQPIANLPTKKLTKGDREKYGHKKNISFGMNPALVQITANNDEMDRRIAAFFRKKRQDVDIQNQREFCNLLNTENEFSCARVDAIFLPRVGQRSHITVTDANRENEMMKTDNITVDTMLHSVPSKRLKTESLELLPRGVEERLDNIECHLKSNVKSVQHDVYSRLKSLEEKILYLEGLSPEYFSYKSSSVQNTSRRFSSDGRTQKGTSDVGCDSELDERLLQLKEKLLSKIG